MKVLCLEKSGGIRLSREGDGVLLHVGFFTMLLCTLEARSTASWEIRHIVLYLSLFTYRIMLIVPISYDSYEN